MGPKRQPPPPESESSEEDMDMPGALDFGDLDPNFSKKFLAKLQPRVRERVAVLQTQDKELEALQAAHDKAVLALRRKYNELAKPIFAKRREIVTGERDATEEEVKSGFPKEHEGKVSLTEGAAAEGGKKGIPNFWVEALRHHIIIDEMISEKDEEALSHLQDVTVEMLPDDQIGFTICFQFEPNEFFSNAMLSKTFIMKELDDEFVLDKAVGTDIEWKQGKNLGVNIVSKKQKNKKGQVRYVNKEEPCPTFFDFFKNGLSEDEEEQNHAMAETFKDKIIPFAVEYFTGEAPNGDSDIEGDDDGEEEDEEDEDDDDEDEEEAPAPMPRGRGGRGGRGGAPPQPDCKQQ